MCCAASLPLAGRGHFVHCWLGRKTTAHCSPITQDECNGDFSTTIASETCRTIAQTSTAMELSDFQRNYEHLTDEELLAVASDSSDLVPEAAAALKAEIRKRGVKSPEPTRWMRQP